MAMEKAFPRDKFDREREFVVVRQFLFNGQTLTPGQPFDKTKSNTRRLRLLYDQRYLRMADPTPVVPAPQPKPKTVERRPLVNA